MPHDATKVLMGSTTSSEREVSNHSGSESTFKAGVFVRLKSDDTLSLAQSDGSLLGVSLGKGQSEAGRVAICRKGLGVPVLLTAAFSPTVGAQVAVSDTTGLAKAYTGTGDRYVNAFYTKVGLNGIQEDGTESGASTVALIDFPGGL